MRGQLIKTRSGRKGWDLLMAQTLRYKGGGTPGAGGRKYCGLSAVIKGGSE